MAKYVQDWLPQDDSLIPFYRGMDGILSDLLSFDEEVDGEDISTKIIADPLLGYIHLSPMEVAIIDTKLFQRLRRIKQLGLAYLVFPSLGYSRFEHSLGVLGRLNQIINKLIENNSRIYPKDKLLHSKIEEYEVAIRLAALLHDLGHCLFSHCSERVISKLPGTKTYPSAKEIQESFSNHFGKEKFIPFAEIITITIIGSARLLNFLDNLDLLQRKKLKADLKHCGYFILGMPSPEDPYSVFLSQLISSGLDADKIDYMIREQHYSGIKLEIDLDRILSKLQVFDLKLFELPKNLEPIKKIYKADSTVKVLGFGKGGQFAFEEFCIARLALHVKIYLHQKVRAAESQLSQSLEDLFSLPQLEEVHNWFALSEAIIEFPEITGNQFNKEKTLFPFEISPDSKDKLRKIEERKIYLRSFSFGPINSLSEGFDDNMTSKLEKLNLDNFFEEFESIELKNQIINEAINIAQVLNLHISKKELGNLIIDIPRLINIQQGQESLHFDRPSLAPLKWTIPIDYIVLYFQENRALAYVFAPDSIASVISLAAEKTIFDLTKKVFTQDGNISRSVYVDYVSYKKTLTKKDYYTKYPQLKEISDYLKTAEASEKIKNIYEKLASFKSLNNDRITVDRITTFVNQFDEDMQDACLSLLKDLRIYNEDLLENEMNLLLDKIHSKYSSIGVSHLGGVTDSGGRLAYYLRPVFEQYNLEPKGINDAQIIASDALIIYDDNINSGLQLLNIFAELLDQKESLPKKLLLNEKHVSALVTDQAREKLKKLPIYFVYIVGSEGVDSKIKKLLEQNLGFNPEKISININTVLKSSEKVFSGGNSTFNHDKKKELRDFFVTKGKELLLSEGKSKEKIDSCHLGYSSAEAMVLFPYNIPTMTVTALWCKGEINGVPWIPLAERRRRTKGGAFIGED